MSFINKLAKKYKVTASDRMDMFLEAAANSVAEDWKAASGRSMSSDSKDELMKALDSFFQGVKYDWYRREDQ